MKIRSKLSACLLALCLATLAVAQETSPGAKDAPAAQPSSAQQPRQPIRVPLTRMPEGGPGVLSADRVRVSQGVASALVLEKVDPVYPPLARQARIQGTVVLHVVIGKDGGIAALDLVSGHPMLAPAAIAAVKQWKYRPYLLNGEPVEVDTQVLVNFTLDPAAVGSALNTGTDSSSAVSSSGSNAAGDSAAQALSAVGGTVTSAPATPRIAAPQRIRVSQGVISGLAISKVPPRYPADARRARIQGTVVMHAIISKTGDIEKLELISGDPALAPAAMEAVQQWKYRPYLFNGNPIEVDTEMQVNFTLSGK